MVVARDGRHVVLFGPDRSWLHHDVNKIRRTVCNFLKKNVKKMKKIKKYCWYLTPFPGFQSCLGHVRKFRVTWDLAVVFAGYSKIRNSLHGLAVKCTVHRMDERVLPLQCVKTACGMCESSQWLGLCWWYHESPLEPLVGWPDHFINVRHCKELSMVLK